MVRDGICGESAHGLKNGKTSIFSGAQKIELIIRLFSGTPKTPKTPYFGLEGPEGPKINSSAYLPHLPSPPGRAGR